MNGAVLTQIFMVRVLVLGVPLLFFKVRVKVAAILVMSRSVFDVFFFEPGVYRVILLPFAEVVRGRLVFFCNMVLCCLRPLKLLMSNTFIRIVTIVVVMRNFLMV